MYDTVHNSGWSKEICEKSGVPMSILPPVKEAGNTFELVLPEMAEKLGVGRNTMVNLGTQDVALSLIHISSSNDFSDIRVSFICEAAEPER